MSQFTTVLLAFEAILPLVYLRLAHAKLGLSGLLFSYSFRHAYLEPNLIFKDSSQVLDRLMS